MKLTIEAQKDLADIHSNRKGQTEIIPHLLKRFHNLEVKKSQVLSIYTRKEMKVPSSMNVWSRLKMNRTPFLHEFHPFFLTPFLHEFHPFFV